MKTHHRLHTEFSADATEFMPRALEEEACATPSDKPPSSLFACATYQLIEGQQPTDESKIDDASDAPDETGGNVPAVPSRTKVGRIYLYTLQAGAENDELDIRLITKEDTRAILDLKWSRSLSRTFVTADSDGNVILYRLSDEQRSLHRIATASPLGDDPKIALSVDWSDKYHGSSDLKIVSSHGEGMLAVMSVEPAGLTPMLSWKGHEFETWIASFNGHDPSVIYSGADDCKFRGWDIRSGTASPTFINKEHTMGVCSIQTNPFDNNLLATGSYDENLRLWDLRNMRRPTHTLALGGGVWKLKWHPKKKDRLLAACMHTGYRVVDLGGDDDGNFDPQIVWSYEEHKSLAYGADWDPSCALISGRDVIATCSFYDAALHIWSVPS